MHLVAATGLGVGAEVGGEKWVARFSEIQGMH